MNNQTSAITPNPYGALLIAAVFFSYTLILQTIPSLFDTKWQTALKLDHASIQLLGAAFYYAYAPVQLISGMIYDRFNYKYILIIGILLCATSASVCGLAESFYLALFSRVLLGVGAAFAFTGFLVLLSHHYPAHRFAFPASIMQILLATSAFFLLFPTSFMLKTQQWKLLFLILSLLGFVIAALTTMLLKNPQPEAKGTLSSDLRNVLSHGENWIVAIYSFAIWTPIAIFSGLWGIPYLKVRYGIDTAAATLAISMIWLGLIISVPILSILSDKLHRRQPMLAFCALIGLVAMLVILYVPAIPLKMMYVLLAAIGIAAAGQNLAFALINDHNPMSYRGAAFGLNSLIVIIGSVLFEPLINLLINWHGGVQALENLPLYKTIIYQRALIMLIPCYGIALFVSTLLLNERPEPVKSFYY